jgi:hypothetical protein
MQDDAIAAGSLISSTIHVLWLYTTLVRYIGDGRPPEIYIPWKRWYIFWSLRRWPQGGD